MLFKLEERANLLDVNPAITVGLPLVTLWQRDVHSRVLDIAIMLPQSASAPVTALNCDLSPHAPGGLSVSINLPTGPVDAGSYSIYYGRYEASPSTLQSVQVFLKPSNGTKTTVEVWDNNTLTANPTPLAPLYVFEGLKDVGSDVLPPCVSLKGSQVSIAVLLPDDANGNPQQPQVSCLPVGSGNISSALPILITNVSQPSGSGTSTLFFYNYETTEDFGRVQAVVAFEDAAGIAKPGPRGTVVAVLKN